MGVGITKVTINSGQQPGDIFRSEPLVFSRIDAERVLRFEMRGTYLLYQDFDTDIIYLSVRSKDTVEHNRIIPIDTLFYMNNQPYPYIDSIILYHRKHKLKGIRLTQQARLSARTVKAFSAKVTANNGNFLSRVMDDNYGKTHSLSNGHVPSSDIDSALPNTTSTNGPIFTRANFKTGPHMFHSTHSLEKQRLNDSSLDVDSNETSKSKESISFRFGLDSNFILRQSEPNLHAASISGFDSGSRIHEKDNENEQFVFDSRL